MLGTNLEEIDVDDLQQLVANGIPEGKSIEYKSEFYRLSSPDQGDRARQHEEMLKDISSFGEGEKGTLLINVARYTAWRKTCFPSFLMYRNNSATSPFPALFQPLKTSESLRPQSPQSFGRRERYLWKHRCATETVTTSTSSSRSCRRLFRYFLVE